LPFRRRRPTSSKLSERLALCHRCGAAVAVYDRTCPSCGSSLFDEKMAILRELRDRDSVTPAAFDVMAGLLAGAAEQTPVVAVSPIRKQVSELRPSDLDECAIWEFALDEEGNEGQDEETVRPRPELTRVDPREGLFVVRAKFVSADETEFDGIVSPQVDEHIGFVDPRIVTGRGQVAFWFGTVPPGPAVIEMSYRVLGKTAAQLFPLRYRSLVASAAGNVGGTIDGFTHYARGGAIVSTR
jgi:hypothetical protein